MTQVFRSKPMHPGNRVARIIDEVGLRGSTISDIDQLTIIHDGGAFPKRFLFQELKNPKEKVPDGQLWMLRDLAVLPGVSVWFVRVYADRFDVIDLGVEGETMTLTDQQYRDRIADWWGVDHTPVYPIVTTDYQPKTCVRCERYGAGAHASVPHISSWSEVRK